MYDWKKLVSSLLNEGTDRVNKFLNRKEQKTAQINTPITEEDILKAIDNLAGVPQEEKVDTVKVKSAGIWSSLDYLYKPKMHGLDEVKQDDRMYFTVPLGWTYDDTMAVQYWYMTFPLGGTEDDVIEFYLMERIDELPFVGVE